MRSRLNILIMLILSSCFTFVCPATETADPTDPNRYLNAVREFADNVLKYGRDTYGPKHTPLFVDGLNIHTHEPVKWIAPNGDRRILSNLASQQTLFRTLDGLTKITDDPKYKQAALEAIEYAFENLRSPNGLLYWGIGTAYDAWREEVFGWRLGKGYQHCLKLNLPHYELMWQVNPEVTKTFIESFWSAHIFNWSNLDMNRWVNYRDIKKPLGNIWRHEYKGGPVFLKNGRGAFLPTGVDLIYAAAWLTKLSGEKEPLVWAKRIAHRYVRTRHPNTGISYGMYTLYGIETEVQDSYDDVIKKLVTGTKEVRLREFPRYHYTNPIFREVIRGNFTPTPGISVHQDIFYWLPQFLVGEMLAGEGNEFRQWALEEFTAFGKASYRREDNVYIPILTDGTNLEGYIVKEDGPLGPKGVALESVPAGPSDFWAYAVGYCVTNDAFMWEMVRDISKGNKFGDTGATPKDKPRLNFDTDCSDPYAILAFLELHRATGRNDFLKIAKKMGDNILNIRFYKGFFVASAKHIYTKFDAIDSLALLHLHSALTGENAAIPQAWPCLSRFPAPYRRKDQGIDNTVIYTLTESPEPPMSLQEAAAVGDIVLVRSLLDKGVSVNSWDDALKKTALHRAATSGHIDIVELLLTKGADIEAGKFNIGTPLHYAAEKGRTEIAELLIAHGADVNAKDGQGRTPIDLAMKQGHREIVKLLLAKSGDVSIHMAAYVGDLQRVKKFIDDGLHVDTKDERGQTALHYAAAGDHKDIAEFLISKGAKVDAVAGKWKTPLGAASRTGSIDVAEYLIAHGADVNSGEGFWTPLQEAAYYSKEMVELLLAHGANINAAGWSPLHSALDAERFDIVELLLARGADVNIKDEKSRTPLHIAAWYAAEKNPKVVELLVSKGADINPKDDSGKTALAYAVEGGYTKIVELLENHMLPHEITITNMSVPSTCVQGDTVPVTISVTNKGDQKESFLVVLFDTTSSVEIAGREMSLEPMKYKSADAADKIFTGDPDATSRLGQEVVLGKDINGDGYGDMFIGAPYYKEIRGRVYIYYGGPNVSFDAPDLILTGEDDNNYFGHDIELADFNNDGHLDMGITALGYNAFQGRVYVYYGGPGFDATADKIFDGEPGTAGRFGREIAAGDINDDGCAELLVCADELNSKKGRAYLFYGAPGTAMDTVYDLTFDGENFGDLFGRALALGKDIDGDGYGDMIIGSRQCRNGDGQARLYYGAQGRNMDNSCDLTFDNQSPGEQFATDVDLFDIDNDKLADIIIAARRYDNIRGRVYIYWGVNRRNMDATPDKYLTGEDDFALFGGDNVDCGYVDNDEYGDILVAGKLYPNGKLKGRMYLYYGNTKALMDTTCDMIFTGENENDRFGYDVAIGDINGDDFSEILTGARTFKNNSFQGRAYLYYGPFSGTEDITFNWDTAAASIGKHTLRATIVPVAGEEDTADNSITVEVEIKAAERR